MALMAACRLTGGFTVTAPIMFLGVLNEPKQECEIADEYRMKGHGMDCMSFRKEGSKKKKCK